MRAGHGLVSSNHIATCGILEMTFLVVFRSEPCEAKAIWTFNYAFIIAVYLHRRNDHLTSDYGWYWGDGSGENEQHQSFIVTNCSFSHFFSHTRFESFWLIHKLHFFPLFNFIFFLSISFALLFLNENFQLNWCARNEIRHSPQHFLILSIPHCLFASCRCATWNLHSAEHALLLAYMLVCAFYAMRIYLILKNFKFNGKVQVKNLMENKIYQKNKF